MATRKIDKTTKHVFLCKDAFKKMLELCKNNFSYCEIVIFVDDKTYQKNSVFFDGLRKLKHNIFYVESINHEMKYKEYKDKMSNRTALLIGMGCDAICNIVKKLAKDFEINYGLIPLNFINEELFLPISYLIFNKKTHFFTTNVPFFIIFDLNYYKFNNKKIITNMVLTFAVKSFYVLECKLNGLFFNKRMDYAFINKINNYIKMFYNVTNSLIVNDIEGEINCFKLFINVSMLFQKNYIHSFDLDYLAKNSEIKLNLCFKKFIIFFCLLEIYYQFFKNIDHISFSPVKIINIDIKRIQSLRNNYSKFDLFKNQYIASVNAKIMQENILSCKNTFCEVFNFLKQYNAGFLYKTHNKIIKFDYLNEFAKNLDNKSNDNILKIIRNFGFLNI